MLSYQPPRNRKLYAGVETEKLLADYYPNNSIEINGESFYKDELDSISRLLEHDHDLFYQVEAFIKAEPENKHDPNAVALYIQDQKVGYINKGQAPFFNEVLSQIGGAAWVLAGMKFVTKIQQYRVRIMVELPPKIDPRAYEFLDLSYIKPIALDVSENTELIEKLGGRKEQIGPNTYMQFFGPATVLLDCITNSQKEHFIRVTFQHQNQLNIPVEASDALYDAILEVNTRAWATAHLIDYTNDSLMLFFTSSPSAPAIRALSPNAAWWRELDPSAIDFADIEFDDGYLS